MRGPVIARCLLACVLAAGSAVEASAGPINTGLISGTFTDPVLQGFTLDPGKPSIFFDNTLTAVTTGIGTSDFRQGTTPNPPPGVLPYSEVVFTGASFANVAPDQEFLLGTLYYYNGSSASNTGIFGITLRLDSSLTVGGLVSPFNVSLPWQQTLYEPTTCSNAPLTSCATAADLLVFPTLGASFNVLEGQSAQALVYGKIVGDPELELTRVVADPNTPAGCVGEALANCYPVPEPSTLILLGSGVGATPFVRRSRRKNARLKVS